MSGVAVDAPHGTSEPRKGWWSRTVDQFGFGQLVRDYLIPVETNSIWYLLGGVLAIALGLEIFTGFLLTTVYTPDAGTAYQNMDHLLHAAGWGTVINFHSGCSSRVAIDAARRGSGW